MQVLNICWNTGFCKFWVLFQLCWVDCFIVFYRLFALNSYSGHRTWEFYLNWQVQEHLTVKVQFNSWKREELRSLLFYHVSVNIDRTYCFIWQKLLFWGSQYGVKNWKLNELSLSLKWSFQNEFVAIVGTKRFLFAQ